MSDNWIINNLNHAFQIWNEKLLEIWQIVSQSPADFKGGGIWEIILTINDGIKAVGYALLVLFFAMSVFSNTISLKEFRNWQVGFRYFLRFVAAKAAVTYGLDIMTGIFAICGGVVNRITAQMGGISQALVSLPQELEGSIEGVGFLNSIPLWIVTLLGCLFIWVLTVILIMTVYGRFFRIYMYTAFSPIPLATFAGETTSSVGKSFIKSYIGVCMEGAVIVLCCVIFSAYAGAGTPGTVDTTLPAVNAVWVYLFEVIFNMLILVGLVKGSDRVIKEMFGI